MLGVSGHACRLAQAPILQSLFSTCSLGVIVEPSNRTRLSRRRSPGGLSISQHPAWEVLHGLMSPVRLPEGASVNTNPKRSQCRILALPSDARDLHSAFAQWVAGPSPHHLTLACVLHFCPHTPGPRALSIGIPEPQRGTRPAHQGKKVASGSVQRPPIRINHYATGQHPSYLGCPLHSWSLDPADLSQAHQHPDSWPHSQQLAPALAVGHHLFPAWLFRLQNLDLISNYCTGPDLMPKLELIFTPGRIGCCWHAAHLHSRRNQHGPGGRAQGGGPPEAQTGIGTLSVSLGLQ